MNELQIKIMIKFPLISPLLQPYFSLKVIPVILGIIPVAGRSWDRFRLSQDPLGKENPMRNHPPSPAHDLAHTRSIKGKANA